MLTPEYGLSWLAYVRARGAKRKNLCVVFTYGPVNSERQFGTSPTSKILV